MIRILYLWNHPFFGPPLVRATEALRGHGIELVGLRCSDNPPGVAVDRCDAIILQTPPIRDSVIGCGKPVIIMERIDGAQLRGSRSMLPNVAGVIKAYTFRDRSLYNTVPDRYHIQTLHNAIECEAPIWHDRTPEPQLSDGELAKIHTGYGFGAIDHATITPCIKAHIDFDAVRPIDVHFAGTVSYENSEVDTHRKLALKAARSWPGESVASAGRSLHGDEYRAGILRSKCVLCPWGWGESSYRDYEAMALGAVVVKPDTDHVEAWPDIYRSWETYIPCEPDFSDALHWIDHIASHPGHWDYMRHFARKLVVDAWQPEAIAAHFAPIIKGMLA